MNSNNPLLQDWNGIRRIALGVNLVQNQLAAVNATGGVNRSSAHDGTGPH